MANTWRRARTRLIPALQASAASAGLAFYIPTLGATLFGCAATTWAWIEYGMSWPVLAMLAAVLLAAFASYRMLVSHRAVDALALVAIEASETEAAAHGDTSAAASDTELLAASIQPVSETAAADLLQQAYFSSSVIAVFDVPLAGVIDESQKLSLAKRGADLLVKNKLAKFVDEGRTEIAITNAGRYWALNGGFMAFLKEDPPSAGGGGRGRNPELEALRSEYMRLRLNTFWWTFGMSVAGLVFSLISIAIAIILGQRGLP